MPAAAILVNPADAVDCEFLNLDFLKDTGLLGTACFDCLNFCFHVILLSFFVAPIRGALWYISLIATAVPTNITTIYGPFYKVLRPKTKWYIMRRCGEIGHIPNLRFFLAISRM